jgi:hypothetical protein
MIEPILLSLTSFGDVMTNPIYFITSGIIAALTFSVVISFINGRKK